MTKDEEEAEHTRITHRSLCSFNNYCVGLYFIIKFKVNLQKTNTVLTSTDVCKSYTYLLVSLLKQMFVKVKTPGDMCVCDLQTSVCYTHISPGLFT